MTTRSFSLLVGLAHLLGGRPGWRRGTPDARPERTHAKAVARKHANRRRTLALASKRRNRRS